MPLTLEGLVEDAVSVLKYCIAIPPNPILVSGLEKTTGRRIIFFFLPI
jgi:hypothetical protein